MIRTVFKPKRQKDGRVAVGRLYRGRYRLEGEKRIIEVGLKTTDKRIAEHRLNEIVSEAENERAGLVPAKHLVLGAQRELVEHLEEYVKELDTLGRSRDYRRRINERVRILLNECKWTYVRDVTADSFVSWRGGKKKLTPKTLNHYRNSMVAFLTWMQGQRRTDVNPLIQVKGVDARGRASFRRRALTVGELSSLLNIAGAHRLVYVMAVTTGLRRGELNALRWDDVKLDGEPPFLSLRASTTKNRRASMMPLTAEVGSELRKLRGEIWNPVARVFQGLFPRRETVKKDFERAGITMLSAEGYKVDFHALRMTFNTMLMEAGVSERTRQELMRHQDPRLTNQTYMDATRLPMGEAVQKLPRLLPTDTQIDTQSLVSASHSGASSDTVGQSHNEPESLQNKANGHVATQSGTMCPDDRKNGGGGNRNFIEFLGEFPDFPSRRHRIRHS